MGLLNIFLKNSRILAAEFQSQNGYLRRQAWAAPIAVSAVALKALTATSSSLVTTITPSAQPDFARIISVTPGGTTADVAAGSYVLTGTDIRGNVITDTLTFSANDTLKQVSVKAFKTVVSLLCPIQDGAGATFSIGVEAGLGIDRICAENVVITGSATGTVEATKPVITYDSTDIAKNYVTFTTSLNAALNFALWYLTKELTSES
jgi:hypothetical protein